MTKVYYCYGLAAYKQEALDILSKHNISIIIESCLYAEGFEFKLLIPDEEFKITIEEMSKIHSCWIQTDRKMDFLDPISIYIKNFVAPTSCTRLCSESKIIHNAVFSVMGAEAVLISSSPTCSATKKLYTSADIKITSEYEKIDLSTIYYKRYSAVAILVVEGTT